MAKLEMNIIHPHAAGIDIGSRSHFVAVGQGEKDVREFGVYADDLVSICEHLKEHSITHVAMESTGNYWQNLYVELLRHGFEVTLCMGSLPKTSGARRPMLKMPTGFRNCTLLVF
ncbi:MAG: transposase [Microcoleus sp. T3-bin5]|nr:transposase [Microcoleus sp. T3-bin5]